MPTIPNRGGIRFVTRCRYLTARCPTGCEMWLHPRAVDAHVLLGRCRGTPWIEDVEDEALVPEPAASMFIDRVPSHLVRPINVSEDRLIRLRLTERVRDDVLHGIVVRSPVEGVRARRWVYVVTAAVERHGPQVIDRAVTPIGFQEVEGELDVNDRLVDCPDCGDTVARSGISLHRSKSTLCRWRRAATEVRALWDAGWRDPFTVPGAPLKWDQLQGKAAWRRRVRTVEFPRWVAVLLSPAETAAP